MFRNFSSDSSHFDIRVGKHVLEIELSTKPHEDRCKLIVILQFLNMFLYDYYLND